MREVHGYFTMVGPSDGNYAHSYTDQGLSIFIHDHLKPEIVFILQRFPRRQRDFPTGTGLTDWHMLGDATDAQR